ncbi:kinesin-domain-containing protein [Suhomyces tanzawaensis NRRL Y-17324]|uniref:Kinesin-like protein n=1 Tax=Suhomyces tanzawaensis NRRL Y-17324 TaxID=984487 RepID=A0A1E4SSB0_9ASCO|nr:kinesin-domain-containing protein [Suhomyces tanzawaensis NRRL Y-17324]ODV82394.1 kinesin-domain-containing protein [Suhomyces tanzawaensis NRRL Y-17324]
MDQFYKKQNELSELNTTKMSLITKMQKEEFKLHILNKEHEDLKLKAIKLENTITNTREERKATGQEYEHKYKITKQKHVLQHESRVNQLKEIISDKIEDIIKANTMESERKRVSLIQQHEHLSKEIKLQNQSLNKALIKLKEIHNKNLIGLEKTMKENIDTLRQTIESVETSISEKQKQLLALQLELQNLNKSSASLDQSLDQLNSKFLDKDNEIQVLQTRIKTKQEEIDQLETSCSNKANQIEVLNEETKRMESRIDQQELARRQLHNKLQELKGNIRVFCRIRPVYSNAPLSIMEVPDDELNEEANQELVLTKDDRRSSNSTSKASQSYKFQFDKIFLVNLTNEMIFEELSQLIQSSLDGFNVCVFAYGQTGSGKTYTMSSPKNGMIPLSINKIFEDIEELRSNGWKYSLQGQFLEIYNDSIVDLLAPSNQDLKHEIKHDETEGQTTITNTVCVDLTSIGQAHQILDKAVKNRSTASTLANERSSRSHSIFILKLRGENLKTGEVSNGTLNLIDLAGSERLSSSQAKGDRLKETQAINKSLSSLGDVIYALGHKQLHSGSQHIPYRNSKLTYLLKHSLGGSSKTLMFVNISPLEANFNETINSLRFATKVNTTKLS